MDNCGKLTKTVFILNDINDNFKTIIKVLDKTTDQKNLTEKLTKEKPGKVRPMYFV